MDTYRGLYSRLSGYNPDQDLDDELDSLLSLPNVNPNQPREWLHIDEQGKTSYTLVRSMHSPHKIPSTVICATKLSVILLKSTVQVQGQTVLLSASVKLRVQSHSPTLCRWTNMLLWLS